MVAGGEAKRSAKKGSTRPGKLDHNLNGALRWIERAFVFCTFVPIVIETWKISPLLAGLYIILVAGILSGKVRSPRLPNMVVFTTPLAVLNCFLFLTLWLAKPLYAQTASSTSYRAEFTVPAAADNGANLIPNIYDSEAIDPQNVCPGYTGSNVTRNDYGLTATLTLAGAACNVYGNDVEVLNLTVTYQAKDRLSVRITPMYMDDKNSSWFILPEYLVPSPVLDTSDASRNSDIDLAFFWSNEPTFSFTVIRKSTGDAVFTTAGTKLIFEDQFTEFVTSMPENYNVYGLGEVIHGLRLGNNFTRTIYAADAGDPIDLNIYGSHPFYVDTRYYEQTNGTQTLFTGNVSEVDSSADYISYSHGVYDRNAHGQEILLRPNNITWRTIGGSIDLYFYDGPTTKEVVASHQVATQAFPAMQQYFAFGYHQCRWGYRNWSQLQDVVDNFARFGIPLDNIWTDIDYMNQYRDFDNDAIRFSYSEGVDFLNKLHANGQHYIPIIDSAIYVPNPTNTSDNYSIFDRGNSTNSFMLNPDGSLYIGSVWPGYTAFPDWLPGSGAFDWWTNEIVEYYNKVKISGIWIDMSEVSSFCVGSCGTGNLTLNPVHPFFGLPGEQGSMVFDYPEGFNLTNATEASSAASASASQSSANAATQAPSATTTQPYLRTTPTAGVRNVDHPPYVINNVQGDLAVHAAAPNATHHNGVQEYDVHNLFGHQILNATYQALLKTNPTDRPFIIGRSTFVGSGKYAGHWGGDNASKFQYMYFGIPQALTFALFGIPMFGVDTCGFNGNSDLELCSRWMQLSAFFPFYRNHNVLSAISQEPYVWTDVTTATLTAMNIRFQLLPYMYTLFFQAHTTGSTVMRALAWEFPNEPALADADRQFFLGPAILVTPVLEQGQTTVDGVFPGAAKGEVYYDWYNQTAIKNSGGNTTIDAPLGHIPVYIRGGHVLATQEMAMTTRDARNTSWSLIVALNAQKSASGELYLDDGASITPNATLIVDLAASNSAIYASSRGTYQDSNPLANITILGAGRQPGNVTLNGQSVDSSNVSYNSTSQAITISGLQNATSQGAWTNDWVLNW